MDAREVDGRGRRSDNGGAYITTPGAALGKQAVKKLESRATKSERDATFVLIRDVCVQHGRALLKLKG